MCETGSHGRHHGCSARIERHAADIEFDFSSPSSLFNPSLKRNHFERLLHFFLTPF